jgi:hypothetical protein
MPFVLVKEVKDAFKGFIFYLYSFIGLLYLMLIKQASIEIRDFAYLIYQCFPIGTGK